MDERQSSTPRDCIGRSIWLVLATIAMWGLVFVSVRVIRPAIIEFVCARVVCK